MKEKLFSIFGGFGVILYYVITLLIAILPFVMIDANFFVNLLLIGVSMFLPITTVIFWIWGLICAIGGPQDVWAIIYYIAFVVLWLPSFISILSSLFSSRR